MIRRPPRSKRTDTLFPYPTLFRALGEIGEEQRSRAGDAGQGDGELAAIRPDQSVDADAVDPYGFGAKPHPGGQQVLNRDGRSEARRGGKEIVRTCSSRWSPDH